MQHGSLVRFAIAAVVTHTGIAVAQPYAYVGLNYEAQVAILDLATNTTVGYLPAHANTFGMAFEPGTNYLHVCGGGHLTKYDLTTNKEVADISLGTSIGDVVAHANGGYVYLGFGTDQCVRGFDTSTYKVVNTGAMPSNTVYLAITNDGAYVFAASASFGGGPKTISLMDTATYTVTTPITLEGMAGSVALSPDNTQLFVGYEFDAVFEPGNKIAVYDAESLELVTDIAVPAGGVTDIAFSSDGSKAYAAHPYIGMVSVIDIATSSVETIWNIGGLPWGVTVSRDDQTVYVAAFGDDFVHVVNASTGAVNASIPVGTGNGGPVRIRIAPDIAGPCNADFNTDGAVNSQDFFDFLTVFFASDPSADFNADSAVNSQDFFDFLTAFFDGC